MIFADRAEQSMMPLKFPPFYLYYWKLFDYKFSWQS